MFTIRVYGQSCNYYVADSDLLSAFSGTLKASEAKRFTSEDAARRFGAKLYSAGHIGNWEVRPAARPVVGGPIVGVNRGGPCTDLDANR